MSDSGRKIRAVIYNRCSTEEEAQQKALIAQRKEAIECVLQNGWELVDVYIEAKSGTTAKGRQEYIRLYDDLETNKFDVIVIKSQDRLMRNTKDWYLFVERMQTNGKRLYMYLDRKFYTPDDSLITGIKAILAEDYSRELSKKINNAHRHRQQCGKVFLIPKNVYGIKRQDDGTFSIVPEEAEMVRLIFQLSADGYGTYSISEILHSRNYLSHTGTPVSPSVIRNIIRNPMYKGDMVQNKKHYDFESKKLVYNPESEWIVHKGVLPAIVDEDLFLRANRGLVDRREKGSCSGHYVKYSNPGKLNLSGKIVCGECGHIYYRVTRKVQKIQVIEWRCSNYLQNGRANVAMQRKSVRKAPKNGGCDNVHLNEERLYLLLEKVCASISTDAKKFKADILKEAMQLLRQALAGNDVEKKVKSLQSDVKKYISQKDMLLDKLLSGVVSDADFKHKSSDLQAKIDDANAAISELNAVTAKQDELNLRLDKLRSKLENGIIDRATVVDQVNAVTRIVIYPSEIRVEFDSLKILGLTETDPAVLDALSCTGNNIVITVPNTCMTSNKVTVEEEKQRVLESMSVNPKITAKQIASDLGMNYSLVIRRIQALKSEGRIRYSTPNGRGHWIIT